MATKEIESLQQRILDLEAEVAEFKKDPYKKMYAGLLKQWDGLAEELSDDDTKVSFLGVQSKNFDRFMEMMDKMKKMMENLEWLRKKIGLEVTEAQKEKAVVFNPLEQRAK